MSGLVTTYQFRLPRGPHEAALDDAADHLCRMERLLHADLARAVRAASAVEDGVAMVDREALREARNAIKSRFIADHGVTGRQYNSLLTSLEGRHESVRECAKAANETDREKLKSLGKKIARNEKVSRAYRNAQRDAQARLREGKALTKAIARRLEKRPEAEKAEHALHHQQRKAQAIRDRIEARERDIARPVPAIVFGGADLLRRRERVHPNDAAGLAAWREEWEERRGSQFLLVGSRDETAGCQSCVAVMSPTGGLTLRVRLPHAIEPRWGKRAVIELPEIPEFGRAEMAAALSAHARKDEAARTALTWRFVRDPRWGRQKRLSAWRAMVTLTVPVPETRPALLTPFRGKRAAEAAGVTGLFRGAIGVDVNADHLAVGVVDRCGNPVRAECCALPLPLRGRSTAQRDAVIGDGAAALVATARRLGLPLVMESLDFDQKKREMESGRGEARNRALSSLAYAKTQSVIRRAAARAGVEVAEVNPAWTSLIGRTNYARRYGLSGHVAAAVAIARRAALLSERINYVHGLRGRRNALPTRSESRRHVWRQWALVRKDEARAGRGDGGRPAAGAAHSASPYRAPAREGDVVRSRERRASVPAAP